MNPFSFFEREYIVQDVAEILGVHRKTVLYWERQRLIPPARRKNGYRIYNKNEIKEIAKLRGIFLDIDRACALHPNKKVGKKDK
jgi:DNA-binding transcriptional MerR regulator